jgi:hypothetical protein
LLCRRTGDEGADAEDDERGEARRAGEAQRGLLDLGALDGRGTVVRGHAGECPP